MLRCALQINICRSCTDLSVLECNTSVKSTSLSSSVKGFSLHLQELEIVIGDEHISFTTSKIGSLIDVNQSKWVSCWTFGRMGTVYLVKVHDFINCTVFQGSWRSSCVLLPGARSEMSRLQSHRSTLQDQAYLKCACWSF